MDKFETLEDYQNSLKEFNERTRKSYENFIQEHGDDSQKLQLRCTPYTEKKGRYGVASLDFGFQIWQSRQAEIDQLKEVLDERTKEWLEAIKLGTYFQDAAKPLKDEVDQLQSQINEMAEVGLSQESAIREKDKRIESALYVLKGLKAENDLWGCDQVEVQIEILEKALRGEHE